MLEGAKACLHWTTTCLLLSPKNKHISCLLHVCSVARCCAKKNGYFQWRLPISAGRIHIQSARKWRATLVHHIFSAEKCFALKMPGKENYQMKEIYWMRFQKGSIVWHFLFLESQKSNILHLHKLHKEMQRQNYCLKKHTYVIFFPI